MSGITLRVAAAALDVMLDSRQKRTLLICIFSVCLALLFLSLSLLPILTCVLLQSSNDAQAPQKATPGKVVESVVPSASGFCWPTPGYTTITSPYGYRVHPITGTVKFHEGVDIGAAVGSPIVAAAAGKVTISRLSSSYGNYVEIDHGNGLRTRYAHMSKRLCSVGDTVVQGQEIGLVGSTGNSTGNHCHFEVRINGVTYDPMQYFK